MPFEGGHMTRFLFASAVLSVWLAFALSGSSFYDESGTLRCELDALVDREDQAFLLNEIRQIQPAYAIRHLAVYQKSQDLIAGGFDGCMPNQITDVHAIPLPVDEAGVLQAAVFLARQREANRDALRDLGFPLEFSSIQEPDTTAEPPPGLRLTLDWAVPESFLHALSDGELTMEEATAISRLPANREMLRHNRRLSRRCGPAMSEETLAHLIFRAGSSDPLQRLWCWINPLNDFGYADLAVNAVQYRRLLEFLEEHRKQICDAALVQIAPFVPPESEIDETFALTVGCLARDWATTDMAGASIEQIKDGWDRLIRSISAGVLRRLQLRLCPAGGGPEAAIFEDLLCAGVTDQRYEKLHELVAFTVLEGVTAYAAGPVPRVDDEQRIADGADLLNRYVKVVIDESHSLAADQILDEGMRIDSPLRALGSYMARLVDQVDGTQAVTNLLREGPLRFIERAYEIESTNGGGVLDPDVMAALHALSSRLNG
jgi:hypothetical protein